MERTVVIMEDLPQVLSEDLVEVALVPRTMHMVPLVVEEGIPERVVVLIQNQQVGVEDRTVVAPHAKLSLEETKMKTDLQPSRG